MSEFDRHRPGLVDGLRLALIARRFYVHGASKLEIAEEFGVSRFKVARMIALAKESGLVQVKFQLARPVDVDLSDELRTAYRLDRAIVVSQSPFDKEPRQVMRRKIGGIAAVVLAEVLAAHDVLGLTWAQSVNTMAEALKSLPRCPVVQLCGIRGGIGMEDRSVETVRQAAIASRGKAYPIFAPLVLPDRQTADTLRQQPGIREAFQQFPRLTKAVVSIGAWAAGESTVFDSLSEAERVTIGGLGVKAEVAARLFDADGGEVFAPLSQQVLAITGKELLAIPEVIGLGYGAPKAQAIDAILRSGMVSTLVTDAAAAVPLLAIAARRPVKAQLSRG